MQRTLSLILILAAGCAAPDIPRLPPLSVGGGGVRMMNEAKSPAEAYENAYGGLTGCHNRVRIGLEQAVPRNHRDAAGALEEITESLRVMRALVVESAKAAFDPYIASYAELAADVDRQRPPSNWRTRIDQSEKEIKSRFSYATAPIVKEWPPGMGPGTEASPPAPRPETSPDGSGSPPPPPAKTPVLTMRLAFKAWKQSHADLAAAFQAGRDPAAAYTDIQAAIAALKQGLPETRHAKLDLMIAVYDQQHVETKGFTTVPAHGSKELILKQLDVVKETLETEYDPDRK